MQPDPRATQIIAQAASDSKTQNVTTLEVNGYTDTSGTATYNMGLSVKRAKAVAAQLVADGVPANEIEMHGYGETHLLVPTGPGVREPQNRRVEIIFH
ncbi:OmpA family protein [Acidocella sp. MX-AZ03]|uniref:OmpA family protein n=1 Tax=Acidocella sp. MX-AZ03 TaxID=2697363 RepID=UPI002FD86B38